MDITGEIRVTGLHSVAHLTESGQRLNSVYSPVGSNFEWAAPEIIGQGELHDERADIYSIGITALELAFNRTPFDDWPPLKVGCLDRVSHSFGELTGFTSSDPAFETQIPVASIYASERNAIGLFRLCGTMSPTGSHETVRTGT